MSEWLQREWQKLGGGALLLLPLAILFRLVVAARRALYRARVLPRWKAPVPVVVVGNITVGGSGKTPLVLGIVEMLQANGFNPGVVARGYGRVPRREADPLGVVRVYPDIATPELFGDEPVLVARRARVPVFIGPDRPAAARALLDAHREVDVLVSDDGLQHYALERDVEIAVVDGDRLFGNGLPLPAGPLREPRSRLDEVDAIVVNGGGKLDFTAVRQFDMRLGRERFAAVSGNAQMTVEEFALRARGARVAAVAGIGNPDRFFEHLARLGIVARRRAFPDHHAFQPAELRMPDADVIVMTEKDAVKCAAFADARMWFLRVEAILPPDFDPFLLSRIKARADGRQAA
jgi:tetraacyldisaccharide 4'-kinase